MHSFYPSKVKELVKREVDRIMEKEKVFETKYTDEEAKRIAAEVSEQVRNAVKTTPDSTIVPRHKIVVQAVVGEKAGQGLRIASKSLWHSEHDSFTTYTYETVLSQHAICLGQEVLRGHGLRVLLRIITSNGRPRLSSQSAIHLRDPQSFACVRARSQTSV